MTRHERTYDPIATVDSPDFFREYLRSSCSEEELAQWVMRHVEQSGLGMTDSVRAIVSEAVGYLPRGEMIEQVVLNERERQKSPGYRRWCIAELEAREERIVREGAVN
jgi:hypothetical protein